MKKMLLGLVAVSVASFAAPDYPNPAPNTTVWETGQVGKIGVTGTITTTPEIIKYVVFASTDAGVSDIQDSLILHPFVISQESGLSIFKDVNPKVYVKRVNETDNGFVELDSSDVVKFKLVRGSGFTEAGTDAATISNADWFESGANVELLPTALLDNSTLESKVAGIGEAAGTGVVVVSADGLIYRTRVSSAWRAYKSANNIAFKHIENGVLEITTTPATLLANYDSFTNNESELNMLNNAFSGNNTGSAISIEVKI